MPIPVVGLGVFAGCTNNCPVGGAARVLKDGRVDRRKPPDPGRRLAFMRGWDAALAGTLFGSVYKVKTHANMGNLFGWIYGDMPEEFRDETWERYKESLGW